jgi:Phospholipase_D-nuclease N-terminal/Short C-terminal domain
VPFAADYPFLDFFWSMLLVFLWIAWIFVLFKVIFDIFRRQDTSGWGKAAWVIFVIFLPFLGVLVYLIAQGGHMANRDIAEAQARQSQFDAYVRETAGSSGATAEIARAKELLDSGAITQAEFDAIKQKALT